MPFDALAPAKINLYLNIVGRRPDGFHLVDSLFVFGGPADRIDGWNAELPHFHVSGEFAGLVGADQQNLVMRAVELVRRESGIGRPLSLCLEKYIPVAAGLGGGSADAAAVLLALDDYWELRWPKAKLHALARELGSDVPACLSHHAVIARGVGDELSPAPGLPEFSLLLANPRVPTATPDVFRAFAAMNPVVPGRSMPALPDRWETLDALAAEVTARGNDLLPAALEVSPAIGPTLEALRAAEGAAAAGLSGSGATCFALFATDEAAEAAGERLRHDRPDWWYWWPGRIMG